MRHFWNNFNNFLTSFHHRSRRKEKKTSKEEPLKWHIEIQWKVMGVSRSILGCGVECGGRTLGNMKGKGKGGNIGAFIGLVPMLAIYVEHLCLPDVSNRDRSNNGRVLRQKREQTIVLKRNREHCYFVALCWVRLRYKNFIYKIFITKMEIL